MDPNRYPPDPPTASSGRRRFWVSLLDGFASFQLFPSLPPQADASDPWPQMWRNIRSDWEAIGEDLRNAARRHTT